MKLSMWMIANQMTELDVKLEISEDAPAVLNSARLAYATNCVHVYQENDYVVCDGEGDRIYIYDMDVTRAFEAPAVLNSARLAYATNCVHVYQENDYVVCDGEGDRIYIYDMDVTRAFELVQSVFDAYEDWITLIREEAGRQEYQKAIDTACRMVKNPMVLFDANNKVLGMTSAYGEHDLDSEWAYLSRYGYSSLNAINMIKYTSMVLFDANNKVLGMTSAYGEHDLDSEWAYLSRYGYSSLNAINMIKYTSGNSEFYSHRNINYLFPKNNLITLEGISYCIYMNHIICGRINLMAKERALNPGDSQLLEKIAEVLQASIGMYTLKDAGSSMNNVFLDLMLDKAYDKTKLQMQMDYQGWTEVLQASIGMYTLKDAGSSMNNVFLDLMLDKAYDKTKLQMQMDYQGWTGEETYYVTVIRFTDISDPELETRHINSLFRMLIQNLTDVCIHIRENELILLSSRNLAKETDSCMLFRNLVIHNPVQIGFSLPDYNGILEISRFYRQAEYVLERNSRLLKPKAMQYFENMAEEYILTAAVSVEDKKMACMPEILRLWQEKQKGSEMFRTLFCFLKNERSMYILTAAVSVEDKKMACMPEILRLWQEKQKGSEMFRTLFCFLKNERSISNTSSELFLHRNTTVYRIKKIQENLNLDLDNPDIRNYCYLSMLFLKTYDDLSE